MRHSPLGISPTRSLNTSRVPKSELDKVGGTPRLGSEVLLKYSRMRLCQPLCTGRVLFDQLDSSVCSFCQWTGLAEALQAQALWSQAAQLRRRMSRTTRSCGGKGTCSRSNVLDRRWSSPQCDWHAVGKEGRWEWRKVRGKEKQGERGGKERIYGRKEEGREGRK